MRRAPKNDRRGGVALVVALSLLPMIAACGLALDLARGWLAQSRLATSVDAAALAGGRAFSLPTAEREAAAMILFWANFSRQDINSASSRLGFMGAVAQLPVVDIPATNTLRVTAQASLPTVFMRIFGKPTMALKATATVTAQTDGMELAMALDVTGSMYPTGIAALRLAAADLVNILYGDKETIPGLWVSIVPWSATINMGPNRATWLGAGLLSAADYLPTTWAGCVEARRNGNDATDAPPSVAPFTPYLWASTLNKYRSGTTVVAGDNDWSATKVTETNLSLQNAAVGPNLGCPINTVLPLTAEKTTLLARITALQVAFRGGTISNLGLQSAWFTISPRWRGLWGNTTLPRDYNVVGTRKVVVLMTDGQNNWYDYPSGAPGIAATTYDNQTVDADYTAYGRMAENRLGIVTPTTGTVSARITAAIALNKTAISDKMQTMCTLLKAQGITVYTITFNLSDTTTQNLYRNCASTATGYFNSPNQTALRQAFTQIGNELVTLRLTR
ncbi:TadE/TadG family type IV pilus assembly protein [Roseomonas sp. 18066]|uniref:TadE/TadG family type IV pilus assembly protein n=1 Tax=Roseomonas sp. 18066 TaxID=2681412 RepID=UPI0013580744|nr:Tad domain-containing protein [Roseomonas sp. 18066]